MSRATAGADAPDEPASYGSVIVELIEEDDSGEELGIDPALVIHPDEVRAGLPLMAAGETAMALFVQAHALEDGAAMDATFTLVEEAVAAGVRVDVIPVLSAAEGYFPNATNAERFAEVARELSAQWRERGLTSTTLYIDMEPPKDLTEALANLRIVQATPRIHIDEERFERARDTFAQLVDDLHAADWRVVLTTQGSILGDYRDGDDDLRQYFNVVVEGIDWDRLDFQLYRSIFSAQSEGLGPHFVYSFARYAREQFPDAPIGAALGVTHPGPIFPDKPSLEGPDALAADVGAARAAGIEPVDISVYNLKGILLGPPQCDRPVLGCSGDEFSYGANRPAEWFVSAGPRQPAGDDGATEELWDKLEMMDALLDLSEAGRDE